MVLYKAFKCLSSYVVMHEVRFARHCAKEGLTAKPNYIGINNLVWIFSFAIIIDIFTMAVHFQNKNRFNQNEIMPIKMEYIFKTLEWIGNRFSCKVSKWGEFGLWGRGQTWVAIFETKCLWRREIRFDIHPRLNLLLLAKLVIVTSGPMLYFRFLVRFHFNFIIFFYCIH